MDWSKAADTWLSDVGWSELARLGFAQIDIDWFDGDPPRRPVPVALTCALAARETARSRYPGLEAAVVLPLDSLDSGLDLTAPDLAHILGVDWEYGPGRSVVGIYLLGPRQLMIEPTTEEYRLPLEADGLLPEPFRAYYRCWRNAADDGAEYDRAIYIHTAD